MAVVVAKDPSLALVMGSDQQGAESEVVGRQLAIEVGRETAEPKSWYAIDLPVAQRVGWMVRHDPVHAAPT